MEAKYGGQVQGKKKFRLKWTKLLHDCFVKAVNQLGGAYEATPKDIVKVMGIKEITTDHIKSYLQYRLSQEVYGAAYTKAAWSGSRMMLEAIQEKEQRRNLARQMNGASICIQTSKGKSPLIEGQTNSCKEIEVPWTINGQNLQAEEAETTKCQLFPPATNDQLPVHPLSSWLTLYEAPSANHVKRIQAAKADYANASVSKTEKKLQTLQTAKDKSAWLLRTKSSEGKGLLSWPPASMRDGIFAGKTMTRHQSYRDLTSTSGGLQVGGKITSTKGKLATENEPIDLNVSAQDMYGALKRAL
ncbi:uncharacterized protein [Coffea arabica]|uniref:Uncharacterized protein isoform X2 n=1 Tax=Coffea arabica TaxID=13443 RepID=A0ABM4W3I5_COFAR